MTVRIPPWLSEDGALKIIGELLASLDRRVSVGEVRRILGVKPEELADDLEVYGVGELGDRERERFHQPRLT
jgi:hypothetical protein